MTEEREPLLRLVPDAWLPATGSRSSSLEEELSGLRKAMETRGVIEQSKGMLMMRHGISADDAFDVLVRWSSLSNVKLAVVATALVGICSASGPTGGPPEDLEEAVLTTLAESRLP